MQINQNQIDSSSHNVGALQSIENLKFGEEDKHHENARNILKEALSMEPDQNKKKTFIYKGQEYEENFGKLVRKLDREQAALNERKRIAFFDRRGEELEPKYRKIMYKDVRAEGLKRYDEDKKW